MVVCSCLLGNAGVILKISCKSVILNDKHGHFECRINFEIGTKQKHFKIRHELENVYLLFKLVV